MVYRKGSVAQNGSLFTVDWRFYFQTLTQVRDSTLDTTFHAVLATKKIIRHVQL